MQLHTLRNDFVLILSLLKYYFCFVHITHAFLGVFIIESIDVCFFYFCRDDEVIFVSEGEPFFGKNLVADFCLHFLTIVRKKEEQVNFDEGNPCELFRRC